MSVEQRTTEIPEGILTGGGIAAAVFSREPVDPRVIVADGAGVSVTVERGHLVVKDGLGKHRRTRSYSRVERTLRRVVIMSSRGYVSLDAYRWCADLGVMVVQVDRSGRIVSGSITSHNDARLIRAQAMSGDGCPYSS